MAFIVLIYFEEFLHKNSNVEAICCCCTTFLLINKNSIKFTAGMCWRECLIVCQMNAWKGALGIFRFFCSFNVLFPTKFLRAKNKFIASKSFFDKVIKEIKITFYLIAAQWGRASSKEKQNQMPLVSKKV